MNMLNSLIIEGVVTKGLAPIPVELPAPEGKEFEVAVSRYYKKADGEMVEDKSYFTVELYGNMAEHDTIIRNVYTDRGVRVVGRLKQKRWTDEEGKEHSKVVVIAEHIEFKPHVKKELPTD